MKHGRCCRWLYFLFFAKDAQKSFSLRLSGLFLHIFLYNNRYLIDNLSVYGLLFIKYLRNLSHMSLFIL